MSVCPWLSKGIGTRCFPPMQRRRRRPGRSRPALPTPPVSEPRLWGNVLLETSPFFSIAQTGP